MTIRLNDFGAFCLSFLVSTAMTVLGFSWWVALLTAFTLTMAVATGIAYAQTTCTTVGNTTYCSNGRTCTVVGNTMYCN